MKTDFKDCGNLVGEVFIANMKERMKQDEFLRNVMFSTMKEFDVTEDEALNIMLHAYFTGGR